MRFLAIVLAGAALGVSTQVAAQPPQPPPPAQAPGQKVPLDSIVAVVGTTPILFSDLVEAINQRRSAGLA